MNIRPISDLRNHFVDVERDINQGEPVFLTKNGYGSMVVMSIELYEHLNGSIDDALDAADRQAKTTVQRISHDEVFDSVRKGLADAR